MAACQSKRILHHPALIHLPRKERMKRKLKIRIEKRFKKKSMEKGNVAIIKKRVKNQ